jgi:hypothetical protein
MDVPSSIDKEQKIRIKDELKSFLTGFDGETSPIKKQEMQMKQDAKDSHGGGVFSKLFDTYAYMTGGTTNEPISHDKTDPSLMQEEKHMASFDIFEYLLLNPNLDSDMES